MSVNDVGVPGQPATNLTSWQSSVRDALNASDTPVNTRITNALTAALPGITGLRVAVGMVNTSGVAVAFPAGRFTAPPTVVAVAESNDATIVTTAGISATGFTVRAFATTGAAKLVNIHWIAVQLV